MRQFVWVLGDRSKLADAELGYSMRSVRRFVGEVSDYFVVGESPKTDPGVPFIHGYFRDVGKQAQVNTLRKIEWACYNLNLTDNFIVMNDDFFVNESVISSDIQTYRGGWLLEHIDRRAERPDHYALALRETYDQLRARGLATVDFEVHMPMPIHRESFLAMVREFDWSGPHAPLWRSCYGNFHKVATKATLDHKLDSPAPLVEVERRVNGVRYFSCGDGAFAPGGELRKYLDREFPIV